MKLNLTNVNAALVKRIHDCITNPEYKPRDVHRCVAWIKRAGNQTNAEAHNVFNYIRNRMINLDHRSLKG